MENVTYDKDENKISFTATVCDDKGVLGKTSSLMFTTEDAIHLKGALDHCVASAEHKAYKKKQEQLKGKKKKANKNKKKRRKKKRKKKIKKNKKKKRKKKRKIQKSLPKVHLLLELLL